MVGTKTGNPCPSRDSSVNNAVTLAPCSGKGHDNWDQDRNYMSFNHDGTYSWNAVHSVHSERETHF